jgi:outer membrane protein insertion porin family
MSANIKCLIFSFTLACALSAHASQRSLDLSPLPPEVKQSIQERFPDLLKSSPKLSDLDQIIQFLIANQQMNQVLFEETPSGVFKISYSQSKRIHSIEITGASAVSASELKTELGLVEKSLFDQNAAIESLERLRQVYVDRGFAEAQIELSIKEVSRALVDLNIRITEGVQQEIKTIDFVSPNPELTQLLRRSSRAFAGEPLTQQTLLSIKKELLEVLSKNSFFKTDLDDPELIPSQNGKSFALIYKPTQHEKYKLVLKGNSQISQRALFRNLELESFHTSNPQIADELANKIKNYYLTQGFARFEIKKTESVLNPFEKNIEIEIQEGPKVKVAQIEISSRTQPPPADYKKFITNNGGPLLADGFYVREEVDRGLEALVVDLQNRGYLKAKVLSSRATFDKDKKNITVFVNLDEGPLTFLKKINFSGNTAFSSETLKGLLNIKETEPLQLSYLESSIENLKEFYQEQGFIEMTLKNEKEELVLYNEDSSQAEVEFKIYEGPKVTVGSILLEGNSFTKNYVILKELEIQPGDVLTPSKVSESLKRLQRLGLFASIDIKTIEERTNISARTVLVRVSEREPGLFNFGVGVNNERQLTLRGYTGVAYRNIEGTARAASLRVDANYNVAEVKYLENKITLGYLEPFLFNSRVRGRVNLSRSKQINDLITDNSQGIETNQTTWSLEQDITSHLTATYELISVATLKDFLINGGDCPTCTTINIASTGPTLDLDYRDHPFNPTKGSFTRLSLEYATPALGSSRTIKYLRGNISFSNYYPLSSSGIVWANSLRYGQLRNLSEEADGGVPYDKKGLILGGQSTVRGFDASESFPNDKYDFPANFLLTTSAESYLFKTEVRFPIFKNWGGAIFYDGGAITIKGLDTEDAYRDSVGVAARYNTPVGAVSAEYGYKLDRSSKRGENQAALHIYIGTF